MRALFRKSLLPLMFAGLAACGGATPPIAPPSVDIGDMTVTGRGTAGDPYVMPNTAPIAPGMGIETLHARGGYWRFPIAHITEAQFARDQAALTAMTFNAGANEWSLRYSEVGAVVARNRLMTFDTTAGTYFGCRETEGCEHRLTVHDADPTTPQYGTFALAALRIRDAGQNYQSFEAIHGGMRTLPMTMPPLGSAVYEGTFEGHWFITYRTGSVDGPTTVMERPASARILVVADFTRGTILFFTPIPGSIPGAPFNVELTGTGRIAGNTFVAEIKSTIFAFPNVQASGATVTGAFYGAGGLEIAATVRGDKSGMLGGLWAGRDPYPGRP